MDLHPSRSDLVGRIVGAGHRLLPGHQRHRELMACCFSLKLYTLLGVVRLVGETLRWVGM